MVSAKFAPVLFSFFVDHYVFCGVRRGNAERGRPVERSRCIMGDGMLQNLVRGHLATALFNINAGLLDKNKTLVGACFRTVWRGKMVLPA